MGHYLSLTNKSGKIQILFFIFFFFHKLLLHFGLIFFKRDIFLSPAETFLSIYLMFFNVLSKCNKIPIQNLIFQLIFRYFFPLQTILIAFYFIIIFNSIDGFTKLEFPGFVKE